MENAKIKNAMITTSTTLLKAIGADAGSPRWTEFVVRYQPIMESFLASRFPEVDAEDVDLVGEA